MGITCIFIGGTATDCINGLLSSLSSEEDFDISETMNISIPNGYYLFPELQFQCETDIKRVYGYFVVDTSIYTSFYFQIWREQNISGTFILVRQVSLNFSAYCQESNKNKACYIDIMILHGLEVETGDFIGFYTHNNTLARPLFSSAASSTRVYLLQSRSNNDHIDISLFREPNFKEFTIDHRPQVIGEIKFMFIL